MIEKVKGIADYITGKSGVYVSEWSVKRFVRRKRDPLPVRKFGARVAAEERELDAWIARQWNDGRSGSSG